MMTLPVFKIIPTTQSYDWGKIGSDSKVAQLASKGGVPGFIPKDGQPYAELWMGTHTKSPSHIYSSPTTTLSSHIIANPFLSLYSVSNLPFLFKVLSIGKALSIQTHPTKAEAEILHAAQPDIYKDDNHKPEMALALTPFEALCGFRPVEEIKRFLQDVGELESVIGVDLVATFLTCDKENEKTVLKDLFAKLMTCPAETFQPLLQSLTSRYTASTGVSDAELPLVNVVLRLHDQFPGDIGIWCVFVLNYITLSPGEAIFLGAGEPHAYISGDIMECMANSDNVIRAGLTPKLRDIPNLLSNLTYHPAPPTAHICKPTQFSSHSLLYDPPIREFSVIQVALKGKGEVDKHRPIHGPSLAIVSEGKGTVTWDGGEMDLNEGDVVFVGSDCGVVFNGGEGVLVVYRAFYEA